MERGKRQGKRDNCHLRQVLGSKTQNLKQKVSSTASHQRTATCSRWVFWVIRTPINSDGFYLRPPLDPV